MDVVQTDHLKAYGVAFSVLKQNQNVDWLLNYRGGSFMMDATPNPTRMYIKRFTLKPLVQLSYLKIFHHRRK